MFEDTVVLLLQRTIFRNDAAPSEQLSAKRSMGLKALHPDRFGTTAHAMALQQSRWGTWAIWDDQSNSLAFWKVLGSDFSSSNTEVAWMLSKQITDLGASKFQKVEGKSYDKYLPGAPWPVPLT